jgi:hypothetical protein
MNGNGTVTTGSNGRGANGRFTAGNGYGRGSPVAKRMHDFRRSMLDAGDAETLQGIFRKIGELALGGDLSAAKLYIEHLVGRPVQAVELTGADDEDGIDLNTLTQIIVAALEPWPEARPVVARALMDYRREVSTPDPPMIDLERHRTLATNPRAMELLCELDDLYVAELAKRGGNGDG